MPEPLLRASGIGVRDVSLSVPPCTLQVIVGPNGAGKLTLLRLLCSELCPSRGSVHYGTELVGDIPLWRLAAMQAVLPQATIGDTSLGHAPLTRQTSLR